jgi:starch-binding outer membrane protein, SusD/RagB family
MKSTYRQYIALLFLLFTMTNCKDNFLNQTPQHQITIDNFYQNREQILATTAPLYGFPWFNMNDKAFACLGDCLAGNTHTLDGQFQPFVNFSVQSSNPRVGEAWGSLYKVVGMANSVINIMPTRVSSNVPKEDVEAAIGEARFIRAVAYFYLVRLWGAVPIVEDSQILATTDANINRNRVEDVYKFIILDLKYAETHCQPNKSADGRVSTLTAKALLSKVYLYQKDYANALKKAEEVINSNQYSLLSEYADCFKALKNNNDESVFALQWKANPDTWGTQNTTQAYLAPYGEGITETGDGWGSMSPSIDMINAYERGDKRKKSTIMTPGDYYPELVSKSNPKGYAYPKNKMISPSKANWRKYIVGAPPANGGTDGDVFFMRTNLNTNILRFAEVYLIASEAILAGNSSTNNGKAIEYFNKVRIRAGLFPRASITPEDILQERRIELAGEYEYWYDLCRFDRAKVIKMISNQERGIYNDLTSPLISRKVVPFESDFLMPIPQTEQDRSPKLKDEPVPYVFK